VPQTNRLSALNKRRPRRRKLRLRTRFDRLTHYVFRYPAKFHPPVVQALLRAYTSEGDCILDPFCGSGTLLVEARVLGRDTIGVDIDPVAVAVSKAKTQRLQVSRLETSINKLLDRLVLYERSAEEYERRKFEDLSLGWYTRQTRNLENWIPGIPNLFHWFRRYVIVDLARIRKTIEGVAVPETHRQVIRVAFASIIRNASNADPVPVSGLEVTSHMRARDAAGRLINPFQMLHQQLFRVLDACDDFQHRAGAATSVHVFQGDAIDVDSLVDKRVDAIITSPPYHGAVDYYRRHKLEMYWLGLTSTEVDRLELKRRYIGRDKVAQGEAYVSEFSLETALAKEWETRIREVSERRADAFRHYMVAMTLFFEGAANVLSAGKPLILVVGHSSWNRSEIPTSDLFQEAAGRDFLLEEVRWYPVVNRYMSYTRHNNASIDTEYALVFRRTSSDA